MSRGFRCGPDKVQAKAVRVKVPAKLSCYSGRRPSGTTWSGRLDAHVKEALESALARTTKANSIPHRR